LRGPRINHGTTRGNAQEVEEAVVLHEGGVTLLVGGASQEHEGIAFALRLVSLGLEWSCAILPPVALEAAVGTARDLLEFRNGHLSLEGTWLRWSCGWLIKVTSILLAGVLQGLVLTPAALALTFPFC
jgi:hypothetical protein